MKGEWSDRTGSGRGTPPDCHVGETDTGKRLIEQEINGDRETGEWMKGEGNEREREKRGIGSSVSCVSSEEFSFTVIFYHIDFKIP